MEEDKSRIIEHQWPRHRAVSSAVSAHLMGAPRGPRTGSWIASTRDSPSGESFTPFLCHLLVTSTYYLLRRAVCKERDTCSVHGRKTWSKCLNLIWFSACSNVWTLRSIITQSDYTLLMGQLIDKIWTHTSNAMKFRNDIAVKNTKVPLFKLYCCSIFYFRWICTAHDS